MDKHFELTEESIVNDNGVTLYRIRCTIPVKDVQVGDLGGFVQSEDNITGWAWVADDAQVFENARARDNALIENNAKLYGNCEVSGDARISENADISRFARIEGESWISGYALIS